MLLYKYGGIWNDSPERYLAPIDKGVQEKDEFVSARDNCTWMDCKFSLEMAFVACYPQHPVMGHILEYSMNNVNSRNYGENTIDITSPYAAAKAFNQFFQRDIKSEIPLGYSEINDYKFSIFRIIINDSEPELSTINF